MSWAPPNVGWSFGYFGGNSEKKPITMNRPCIAADRLAAFATAVFAAVGVLDSDAHLIADSLVRANLWGHQSHGVMRLNWYVERIRTGVMHAVTQSFILMK